MPVRPESFGPTDWDVEFVDPACIYHGSRVRPVRKEGVDLLVDSIRRTGWDPTSLVVLYRDPDQAADTHTPQRFLCLDGMHRVHAVRHLLAEKHTDWPSEWVDAENGDVRMRCSVIRGAPARESVVKYALLRNSQTSAVVKTSYIDTLTSIGAACQAAVIELPGIPQSDKLFKLKVFDIMKRSSALSNSTLRGDLSMQFDLHQDGTLAILEAIGDQHGHGWFTRKNLAELAGKAGPKFVLRVLGSWIERCNLLSSTRSRLPKTDVRKGQFFSYLVPLVSSYYETIGRLCNAEHSAMASCCTADPDTLKAAMDAVVHSLELEVDSVRAGEKPEVSSELKKLVLARTAALFPPVPRLEEPVAPAPPRTAAPATPDRVVALPQKPRSPVAKQSAPTYPPEARTPPVEKDDYALPPLTPPIEAEILCTSTSAPPPDNASVGGDPLVMKKIGDNDAAVPGFGNSDAPAEASATSPEKHTAIRDSADATPLAAESSDSEIAVSDTTAVRRVPRKRNLQQAFLGESSVPQQRRRKKNRRVVRAEESAEEFEDDPSPPSDLSDSAERSDCIEDENNIPLGASGRPAIQPDVIPYASAICRKFGRLELARFYACTVIPGSGDERLFASDFYISHMNQVGYCVIPDIFSEELSSTSVMSRDDVNTLLDFFKATFLKEDGKCCDDGPIAFAPILNTEDTTDAARDASLRFQTSMDSIHQHLEKSHPELFRLKLRLDIVAALLLKELRVESSPTCNYRLPNTGGRLLLSAPGCSAQVPHTDYKVRYLENGREVFDPSYFVIQTGRDNASLLVWPGSHHIAAEFERFADACKANETNPGVLVHDKLTLQTYEKRLCGDLKPQQVHIPPFSAFIGRGDLVHAGDAHNGPEPTVRTHVHCTATRDMLANSIFIRPFGN